MLLETAALSGAILLIIGTATGMAWALTQSGFSRQLAAAMAAMPGGWFGFMLVSIVAFVVLGSVLEGIPAIVLFGPLLFPIARQAGINEVHYAMVVILAMGIGLFAPPLGVGYYAACAIGRVSPDAGMRRIWPYLGALLVGLLVRSPPFLGFPPGFSDATAVALPRHVRKLLPLAAQAHPGLRAAAIQLRARLHRRGIIERAAEDRSSTSGMSVTSLVGPQPQVGRSCAEPGGRNHRVLVDCPFALDLHGIAREAEAPARRPSP